MTDHRMMDPTTLRALAKRVEAGESGREIDAEIAVAARVGPDDPALGYVNKFPVWRPKRGGKPGLVETVGDDGRGELFWQSPRLTTSLDAIEALRVRLLPGSTIEIQSGAAEDSDARWFLCALTDHRSGGRTLWPTRCNDECRARLAALLYAVAAKVEAEGGKDG